MFSSRNCDELHNIKFDNETIEWVKEYKYLGLILTSTMSFAPHIDHVCTQVSRYTGLFYHLQKSFPRQILMLLYNAFILPHFILHIEIWGSVPDCHLKRIIIKQNKLLRAILGVVIVQGIPTVHTVDMYKSLRILTVRNLYKLSLFKFMIFMRQGYLPYFYNILLRPLETDHSYNTRSNVFRHPLITSEVERRSILHQLVILNESILPEMYNNVSVQIAFSRYKKHLLDNQ